MNLVVMRLAEASYQRPTDMAVALIPSLSCTVIVGCQHCHAGASLFRWLWCSLDMYILFRCSLGLLLPSLTIGDVTQYFHASLPLCVSVHLCLCMCMHR